MLNRLLIVVSLLVILTSCSMSKTIEQMDISEVEFNRYSEIVGEEEIVVGYMYGDPTKHYVVYLDKYNLYIADFTKGIIYTYGMDEDTTTLPIDYVNKMIKTTSIRDTTIILPNMVLDGLGEEDALISSLQVDWNSALKLKYVSPAPEVKNVLSTLELVEELTQRNDHSVGYDVTGDFVIIQKDRVYYMTNVEFSIIEYIEVEGIGNYKPLPLIKGLPRVANPLPSVKEMSFESIEGTVVFDKQGNITTAAWEG